MALADTQKLTVELGLVDKLSPAVNRIDKRLGAFSGAVNRNLGKAVDTVVSRGIGALSGAITSGLGSLAELESAVTSVDGAIKTMGLTGQVTGKEVAVWANEIEASVGAAFDDKAITAAAATLIRYGKISKANLRPALVVMTDLAAKTGSVESASTLLAKALADPTKAAGKLARQGIVLTKTQQQQIEAFVKAGKVGKAQQVILDALTKSTKGAAEASQGPYKRALSTLADVSEDAKKALAEGFLPVIERVAKKLSQIVADPKAIQSIRDFGNALAGAFDKAVTFAEGVDWHAVGAGLKSAYDWGTKLVGVFTGLPTETKGLIIGLAGLSKLTGGAPIKIAVDFAKDALSGIFGHFFDRGASPANPLWVQSAGGGVGGPGGVPAVPPVGVVTPIIGAGVALDFDRFHKKVVPVIDDLIAAHHKLTGSLTGGQGPGRGGPNSPGTSPMKGWAEALKPTNSKINSLHHGAVAAIDGLKTTTKGEGSKTRSIEAQGVAVGRQTRTAVHGVQAKQQASLVAFRAGERATLGVKSAVNSKLASANAKLDGIRHKKTSFRSYVTVNAKTAVSVRNVNSSSVTSNRYSSKSMLQAS